MSSGYDIIGDVHGQGTRLEALLGTLGYEGQNHPDDRKIIFVGDFIDRGTENAKTLDLVRSLVDAGRAQAILGNHEFNAICYAKRSKRYKGGYVRPHTESNQNDLSTFLAEYPFGSKGYKTWTDWFSRLPLFLETPEFRVVHACWHVPSMQQMQAFVNKGNQALKPKAYASYDKGGKSSVNRALEMLLKGPAYKLPSPDYHVMDSSGLRRPKARIRWWDAHQTELSANDRLEKGNTIPDLPPKAAQSVEGLSKKFCYRAQKPLFFGHYNILSDPFLTASTAACVNFKDRLVAYQWHDGDRALAPDRFVFV